MRRHYHLLVVGALLIACALASRAEEHPGSLTGICTLSAASKPDEVNVQLRRDTSAKKADDESSQMQMPASTFQGFGVSDLAREGAHADAVIVAEAGRITCSGTVQSGALRGRFTFLPDQAFVSRMQQMGFSNLDTEKLEAYTLFRVETPWIQTLQREGVTGLNSDNLLALRIFHADAKYVENLKALGYPAPDADSLVALSVQHVDPAEVKQFRAMGYKPTLDELVQIRIFKVTPAFARRMQDRGLGNLTISKLVQIRIFKLAD